MTDTPLDETNDLSQPTIDAKVAFKRVWHSTPANFVRTVIRNPYVSGATALCLSFAIWNWAYPDSAQGFANGVGEVAYESKEALVRGLKHIG